MKKSKTDVAVKVLLKNGVVIFPTDTVWGIGASIKKPKAIKKLYKIKKRDPKKPIAVLVADLKMAKRYGIFTKPALALANKYWPGGLTIIVKAKGTVPEEILRERRTIGLRQPNHKQVLFLIKKLRAGLVATSANFSGQPDNAKKSQLNPKLIKLADYIMAGENKGNKASTVIDTTVKPFKIIRPGELKISNS